MIDLQYKKSYREKTKHTHIWSKIEIFLGFQMDFPKFL